MKNLKLTKPIAFIDVETTGTNPNSDRIVELSILKVHPDGREEHKSHRVNPGMPIPAEATAVHGITDVDVANLPTFCQYAKSVKGFLDGCDIGGFNVIKFDLPCLEAEFARVGVEFSRRNRYLVDSMVIYHQRDPRNLQTAYQKYCGGEMESPHVAAEDVKAAAAVLDGQLEQYQDLPRDVKELCEICNPRGKNYVDPEGKFIWVDSEVVCNFGKKHRGHRLRDIVEADPSYLSWIAGTDFSPEVITIVAKALDGHFPEIEEPF